MHHHRGGDYNPPPPPSFEGKGMNRLNLCLLCYVKP